MRFNVVPWPKRLCTSTRERWHLVHAKSTSCAPTDLIHGDLETSLVLSSGDISTIFYILTTTDILWTFPLGYKSNVFFDSHRIRLFYSNTLQNKSKHYNMTMVWNIIIISFTIIFHKMEWSFVFLADIFFPQMAKPNRKSMP